MHEATKLRILFTGYAAVHFICFRPLYDRLATIPGVEIYVSGGLRTKTKNDIHYDEQAMYTPFNLPAENILSVEEIRDRDFDMVFAGNTKMILPRSASIKVQIFHGVSFRNKAIRPQNMNWDYYFMIGPYMRRRFAETGLIPADDPRAVPIGFMKADSLVDGSLSRTNLLKQFGFSGNRPVVLYAPTGAKRNSLEIMGEDVIANIAASAQFDLLIKPHDHPRNAGIDWFEKLAGFEDAHCKLVREPDVIPLLHLSDLLISDASSVANEYTLLDRPIVYLDTPELIAKAGVAENSMLDLVTWGRKGGLVARNSDEVVAAVCRSLDQPKSGSPVRKAIAQDLFYNPGQATDMAVKWIYEEIIGKSWSQFAGQATNEGSDIIVPDGEVTPPAQIGCGDGSQVVSGG